MTVPRRSNLAQTWIDLAVYVPIGVVATLHAELPDVIERGRKAAEQRVAVARFIGQMAVTYTRNEAAKARQAPSEGAHALTTVDGTISTPVAGVSDAAPAPSPPAPFEDYDALPASNVVQRMNRLTPAELEAVVAYEQANRRRRTILAKADSLR
jgi:hypothetical protein